MLWDLFQQAQIRGLQSRHLSTDVAALQRDKRHDRRADDIEERLEHLTIVTEALWTLLHDRLGLTDEQLVTVVAELIAEQAAERAPIAEPARCVGCGAALNRDLDHCQFCGQRVDRPANSAFDTI